MAIFIFYGGYWPCASFEFIVQQLFFLKNFPCKLFSYPMLYPIRAHKHTQKKIRARDMRQALPICAKNKNTRLCQTPGEENLTKKDKSRGLSFLTVHGYNFFLGNAGTFLF